jgi:hypothetical protein
MAEDDVRERMAILLDRMLTMTDEQRTAAMERLSKLEHAAFGALLSAQKHRPGDHGESETA